MITRLASYFFRGTPSLKRLAFPLLLLISISTQAGVLETLSHGSYFLSKGSCPKYNESQVEASLGSAECLCDKPSVGINDQIPQLSKIKEKVSGNPEDRFFALLAKQHSKELSCAGGFADSVASGPAEIREDLTTKIKLLRVAKQQLVQASENIASNPDIISKVCPLTLGELKPRPLVPGQKDPDYEACKVVIISRAAYQTTLNSIPLANMPSVRSLLETYANTRNGPSLDKLDADLDQKLKDAYVQAKGRLSEESKKIDETLKNKGGVGFERSARYALLSDPRVVAKVLQDGGNDPNLKGLACQANARYGEGADSMETGLLVGTLAFSGGAGLVMRAGSTGLKIAEGAMSARSAGVFSLNASRALQVSAFVANSASTYSMVDKACFAETSSMLAQGTDDKGACVSAPEIKQLAQDSCVLAASLSAVGYTAIAAGPATKFLGKLKGEVKPGSLTPLQKDQLEARRIAASRDSIPAEFAGRSIDTFKVKKIYQGEHGGNRIAVERQFGWDDPRKDFTKGGGDITTDLRLWPTMLGREKADFFGFRVVSDKYAILPDDLEISGAIKKFNTGLPPDSSERVAINFYGTKDSFVSPKTYVEKFAKSGELPMSRNGRQYYHDVSSHSMEGFLFNNEFVDVMRTRANLWMDFVDSQKNIPAQQMKALLEADKAVTKRLTADIDETANMIGSFVTRADELFLGKVGYKISENARSKLPPGASTAPISPYPIVYRKYHPQLTLEKLVSAPPTDYFLPFLKGSDPELASKFSSYVAERVAKDATISKQISFDWVKEIEWLSMNRDKIIKGDKAIVDEFANLKLTKPFFMRLKRLEKLTEDKP